MDSVIIRSNFRKNDLLSCFGVSTKETRISAYIGFLLSNQHEGLIKLFDISGYIYEIIL